MLTQETVNQPQGLASTGGLRLSEFMGAPGATGFSGFGVILQGEERS